ncbi:hypothetical protein BDD12DRAFT_898725 [Trichophaea hybrida]|nr:hypothetical protein BDD12DRAFT_898725 [Trichophaea hybrida]
MGSDFVSPHQLIRRDTITTWWYADPSATKCDPAKQAFDNAVSYFSTQLTTDESAKKWIQDKPSFHDVEITVIAAKMHYETRSKQSKAREWLGKFSARIVFYSSVLDVFVQHHPEYVSLVWGAMKFLFVVVVNHEELIAKISKALSLAADVLPRTDLSLLMYPTDRIKQAVSRLYAYIIQLMQRAVGWYKQGRVRHALSAIANPFSLTYQDIVDNICEASRNVDNLASAAARAEQRDMHIQIQQLARVTHSFENQISLHAEAVHARLQLADIRCQFKLEGPAMAESSLLLCQSLRDRRRRRPTTSNPPFYVSPDVLQSWASVRKSSILLATASNRTTSPQDFATGVVELVKTTTVPVLWVLKLGDESRIPSLAGIGKSLVFQLLQFKPETFSTAFPSLTITHFLTAKTGQDWFQILAQLLKGFQQVCIVVNANLLPASSRNGVATLLSNIRELVQICDKTRVKIVIAGHRVEAKDPDIHTMTLEKGAPRDGAGLRGSSSPVPAGGGRVGRCRGTGRGGRGGRGRGRTLNSSTMSNVHFPLD